MLSGLQNAFKAGDLRSKIIFTLLMFLVFRIGAHIPVPGVDPKIIADMISKGALLGFFDVISGGAFKNFSVFAMSIVPYINASIIMQLLTVVVPTLEKLSKEGEEGRKKMTQYIRYGTVVLGFIQALGLSFGVLGKSGAVVNPSFGTYLLIAITLTAGTAFLMWLGEQITEKGIGNGISLIIFAGIVSSIPGGIKAVYQYIATDPSYWWSAVLLVVIGLAVIVAVIAIQEGQRRIPVQYAKRVVGRKVYGGQSTHIPMKVNSAGVIPVIFASSLLMFPITIAQFFPGNPVADWVGNALQWGSFLNSVLFALLIIGFTYFYTSITFNPNDIADNMKKHGGFIPGLRPGRPTAEYLTKVMYRLNLSGAIFLAAIAVLPTLVLLVTKIPNIQFGGTSLLIVVGVALETMKQIESHLLMRHYQGFMK
ncbi:MAG: preprotein translocase subunit SecY [Clostridia bacterium]|nr:preprotein translocase subunit SecY [Clostridia bacterium]